MRKMADLAHVSHVCCDASIAASIVRVRRLRDKIFAVQISQLFAFEIRTRQIGDNSTVHRRYLLFTQHLHTHEVLSSRIHTIVTVK